MAVKIYALDFDNEEWADWLAKELDQPKFRADQICQWLWQKRTFDAEEMTNLSKTLRDSLSEMVDFRFADAYQGAAFKDGWYKKISLAAA